MAATAGAQTWQPPDDWPGTPIAGNAAPPPRWQPPDGWPGLPISSVSPLDLPATFESLRANAPAPGAGAPGGAPLHPVLQAAMGEPSAPGLDWRALAKQFALGLPEGAIDIEDMLGDSPTLAGAKLSAAFHRWLMDKLPADYDPSVNQPQSFPERLARGAARAVPWAATMEPEGALGVLGNIGSQAISGIASTAAAEAAPDGLKRPAAMLGSLVGSPGAIVSGAKALKGMLPQEEAAAAGGRTPGSGAGTGPGGSNLPGDYLPPVRPDGGAEDAAAMQDMPPQEGGAAPPLPPPGGPGGPTGAGAPPPPPPPPRGRGALMVMALSPEDREAELAALERGGVTPENFAQTASDMHPEQRLGEITPGMVNETAGMAAPAGNARNLIGADLTGRSENASTRIDSYLTDTIAPYQPVGRIKRELDVARASASDPLYARWNGTGVPMTPAISGIMPQLEATGAVTASKQALREEGLPYSVDVNGEQVPTARAYDYMLGHLSNRISQGVKVGDGRSVRRWTGLYNNLTDAIDNHPDQNVAGIWKAARQAYQDPTRVDEAVDIGRRFFDPRTDLDSLQQRFNAASPEEVRGLLQGVRADAAHRLEGTASGDAALRRSASSTEAKLKLEWLVGPKRAAQFQRNLEAEAQFAEAPKTVLGNQFTGASAEARAQAAKNYVPQEKGIAETAHEIINSGGPAVGLIGHLAGLEPTTAIGLGAAVGGYKLLAKKAAEKAAEKSRTARAPIRMLHGADAVDALHELFGTRSKPAPTP